jgi:Flp pilus assembly protein CpaB
VFGALAVALGLVAVRGVAQREAAVAAQIGPIVRVVVLAHDVPADHPLRSDDLAYRQVPLRWVAPTTVGRAGDAVGLRTAVGMQRGTPLTGAVLTSASKQASAALASGDRVLELVAAGSARLVKTGTRVDVVKTAERSDGTKATTVVAESVEVIDVRDTGEPGDDGASQVDVTVRVSRHDALKLAAAQDSGGSLRLLPRAAWDQSALLGTTP